MTTTTPPSQPPVQIVAALDTRLAQLHQRYAEADAAYKAAKEALDAVKTAIKADLVASAPEGTTHIDLVTQGTRPLQLVWKTSWRIDATRLKAEDPTTYVRYAKQSGTWVLLAAKGGGAE